MLNINIERNARKHFINFWREYRCDLVLDEFGKARGFRIKLLADPHQIYRSEKNWFRRRNDIQAVTEILIFHNDGRTRHAPAETVGNHCC